MVSRGCGHHTALRKCCFMNDTFAPPTDPDFNPLLSFEGHPGPAWPARGWCGLRLKGPLAYVADCTPVDKALRCSGQRALSPRRPTLTEYTSPLSPAFLSDVRPQSHTFLNNISFIHQPHLLLFTTDSSPVALFVTPSLGSGSAPDLQMGHTCCIQ